ncbi:hypothetical protein [Pseudomonas sp. MF2857]|nr:hypothetical protein [Pseudomonas sp. MF2857]MBJ2303502.1 hypothetical protein [Pseudomonas sp. MF2846]
MMDWLRLWHDMPNDPKWRTIARVSGQPIALVQAMYLHLLVDASVNVTRGHVTVTKEDIASALDVTDEQVEAVFSAMQGRVIDGDKLTGWEGRQPKREDAGNPETGAKSAAQRKRDQRERERNSKQEKPKNDTSRSVTESHDRLEKIREDLKPIPPLSPLPENPAPAPEPKLKRKCRLPEPFNVTGDMRKWAAERTPGVSLTNETEKFVNHWRGNGQTKLDWIATWRNWLLKAQEYANQRTSHPQRTANPPLDMTSTDWALEPIL